MPRTTAETEATSPALAIFTLGQAETSLSFIGILPVAVRDDVTTILAYRLLSKLWAQYRIDCGLNHGRTLFSLDNGYELRLFATLVDGLAEWSPLRSALAMVRAHATALSPKELHIYEYEYEGKRELLEEVCDQMDRLPVDLDPVGRSTLLIERCQKIGEWDEVGICWALNLATALRMDVLGVSKASLPCPALLRREILRFDRSKSWRDKALLSSLSESAHGVAETIFAAFHGVTSFETRFSELRSNSRLRFAYVLLAGIGELSPSILSQLVGCSEPGARKMLKQLADAGFARHHPPAPGYVHVERYRLGWARASWLRSYSLDTGPPALDFFDE